MLFHHQHCHGPFNPDPEPALVKQSDLHLKRVGWKIESINKEKKKWTYVQIRSTGLDKKYFWIFKKLETTDI